MYSSRLLCIASVSPNAGELTLITRAIREDLSLPLSCGSSVMSRRWGATIPIEFSNGADVGAS